MPNRDVSGIELRSCLDTLIVFTNIMMRHDHNTLFSFKFVKHGYC